MRNKHAKVSDPNSFITCPGDPVHIIYSPVVGEDGTIDLVESGKENIQDYIDSFRETTDMAYILKQLQLGDTSVLNQKQPMYGDFTQMPKTNAELLQIRIDAEKAFYDLPLETRQKFNNSFSEWFATNGKPEWFEKMADLLPKKEDVIEEVKEDAP